MYRISVLTTFARLIPRLCYGCVGTVDTMSPTGSCELVVDSQVRCGTTCSTYVSDPGGCTWSVLQDAVNLEHGVIHGLTRCAPVQVAKNQHKRNCKRCNRSNLCQYPLGEELHHTGRVMGTTTVPLLAHWHMAPLGGMSGVRRQHLLHVINNPSVEFFQWIRSCYGCKGRRLQRSCQCSMNADLSCTPGGNHRN